MDNSVVDNTIDYLDIQPVQNVPVSLVSQESSQLVPMDDAYLRTQQQLRLSQPSSQSSQPPHSVRSNRTSAAREKLAAAITSVLLLKRDMELVSAQHLKPKRLKLRTVELEIRRLMNQINSTQVTVSNANLGLVLHRVKKEPGKLMSSSEMHDAFVQNNIDENEAQRLIELVLAFKMKKHADKLAAATEDEVIEKYETLKYKYGRNRRKVSRGRIGGTSGGAGAGSGASGTV